MTTPRTIEIGAFRAMLCLDGWDERSVWGWDPQTGTLFAHLWPNGEDSDDPAIMIPSGWDDQATRWPATNNPAHLVTYMGDATKQSDERVIGAMACHAPQPLKELFSRWLAEAATGE